MRHPFRSESAAFNFLLLTVVAFAIVAAASLLGGWWVGVPVWILVTLGAVFIYLRAAASEPPARVEPVPHIQGERRILVIAEDTVGEEALTEEIHRRSEGVAEHVLVVEPALTTRMHRWASDEDGARAQAQARVDESLARLHAVGVNAEGVVGDDDPLQAVADALRTFGADEIVISTNPEGRSHWLERGVVEAARERFSPPVTHIVVDLATEREFTVESPASP